jgi:hypothetical protein
MIGRAVLATLVIGCHFHRDVDAPGVVDPLAPPKDLASPQLEYPGDPGEHRLMLTSGLLGGPGGGSIDDGTFVDLAGEVTVSWGDSPTTHNDRAATLLLPRSVVVPPRSHGVTLGWSALRFTRDAADDIRTTVGPIYVEGQRSWTFAGFGGGWALDPRTGATGPQVQGFFAVYFARARVLFGDGWEIMGGLQLKIPATWVWRR